MSNASPKVDDYIANAPDFARPILFRLRKLFHQACPQIQETIKWGFPHFERGGIVGSMAAFKGHVSFGFWKGSLMSDPEDLFMNVGKTNMSAMKVKSLAELPADAILLSYIREAALLNETDVKPPQPKPQPKKDLKVPDWFVAALKKNKKALAVFDALSPSHKREYAEWVAEGKRDATRDRRMATAIEWMAAGKPRNWKYMKR